ncbi:putative radical SAM enzyme (TIGR03279 family) [Desulfitispora alkaliphila]|uniref:DUF512 domain-containing protein n=1 Tax=Desulfitispora alkaliphila TaxID=622674 RepID=UPI003D1DF513
MSKLEYPEVHHVAADSIAEELGINPGDRIVAINGKPVVDLIEYRYAIAEEYIELEVLQGEELWLFEIEKDLDEDLGINFESAVFDRIRKCQNKCIFCFIDQMPRKMRKSLYVKDDDYRLSFLHGNYITLTNLDEKDLERIIQYRMSPLYISVHATDGQVRENMLNNPCGKGIIGLLKRLTEAEIDLHTQIVLVPGVNDGEVLEQTLGDLAALQPHILSVAVVPVGLTNFREKLAALRPFTPDESKRVIETIAKWQQQMLAKTGQNLVYAADEFFFRAKEDIPSVSYYGSDYSQLENGIGLVRKLWDDFQQERHLLTEVELTTEKRVAIVTGELGVKSLSPIVSWLRENLSINVMIEPVENRYFGEKITVTGLVTGGDVGEKLNNLAKDNSLKEGDVVFIPDIMLKDREDLFLDDVTVEDLQAKYPFKIVVVASTGDSLSRALRLELEVK